jgi:hypothetical protein
MAGALSPSSVLVQNMTRTFKVFVDCQKHQKRTCTVELTLHETIAYHVEGVHTMSLTISQERYVWHRVHSNSGYYRSVEAAGEKLPRVLDYRTMAENRFTISSRAGGLRACVGGKVWSTQFSRNKFYGPFGALKRRARATTVLVPVGECSTVQTGFRADEPSPGRCSVGHRHCAGHRHDGLA